MSVHVTAGVVVAAAGALAGPALAGLQLSAPGSGPLLVPGWWRGGSAARATRVAVTAVAAAVVLGSFGLAVGWAPILPALCWLGALGVVLVPVDVAHHRLPDRLVLPSYAGCAVLLGAAAAVSADLPALLRALAAGAAVFAGGFLLALLSPAGLGFGDVKLLGLLALVLGWFGWDAVLLAVLGGFVLGGLAAVVLLAARRATLRTALPLGPALLLAAWPAALIAGW